MSVRDGTNTWKKEHRVHELDQLVMMAVAEGRPKDGDANLVERNQHACDVVPIHAQAGGHMPELKHP
jgi:hypothetical protein